MKKMTTIAIAAMVASSLVVIPVPAEAIGRVDAGAGDGQTMVVDNAKSAVADVDSVLMVDGQDGDLVQVILGTERADGNTEVMANGETVILSVSRAPGSEDAPLVVRGQGGSVEQGKINDSQTVYGLTASRNPSTSRDGVSEQRRP